MELVFVFVFLRFALLWFHSRVFPRLYCDWLFFSFLLSLIIYSFLALGKRPVLACALSVVQRVPDLTWQPHQLLRQRQGGFLQSGLFQVRTLTLSRWKLQKPKVCKKKEVKKKYSNAAGHRITIIIIMYFKVHACLSKAKPHIKYLYICIRIFFYDFLPRKCALFELNENEMHS